jgi:hypothetical protein
MLLKVFHGWKRWLLAPHEHLLRLTCDKNWTKELLFEVCATGNVIMFYRARRSFCYKTVYRACVLSMETLIEMMQQTSPRFFFVPDLVRMNQLDTLKTWISRLTDRHDHAAASVAFIEAVERKNRFQILDWLYANWREIIEMHYGDNVLWTAVERGRVVLLRWFYARLRHPEWLDERIAAMNHHQLLMRTAISRFKTTTVELLEWLVAHGATIPNNIKCKGNAEIQAWLEKKCC